MPDSDFTCSLMSDTIPLMIRLNRLDGFRWEIPRGSIPGMRVPGLVLADDAMMTTIRRDESLRQVAQAATLPGATRASIAMPDIHFGYGFPIGGVLASRIDSGVVSPGGVGFDINCGVRLLRTSTHIDDLSDHLSDLVNLLFRHIPTGVGSSGALRLDRKQLQRVVLNGSRWAVDAGFGTHEDLDRTEDTGCLQGCRIDSISDHAFERGIEQLGTLGSGNHFIEVQYVEEVFDPVLAAAFGLETNRITFMIHTGSRGFGHQICTDYLRVMGDCLRKYGISTPDRQLACAPFDSKEGQSYLSAMRGAANFAWANRQCITHRIREVWERLPGHPGCADDIRTVYDLAHNIIKIEDHDDDGHPAAFAVHRKGATRAFTAGSAYVPESYRPYGQPVIVPGDMARASYVLCGTKAAETEVFASSCHGAGWLLSRKAAIKAARGRSIAGELNARGIRIAAKGKDTLAEEMPEAYKPIEQVVGVMIRSGLANPVARLRPLGVIKG
mgnify:FL=1